MLCACTLLRAQQSKIPLKPDAEFDFRFDYSFRERFLNDKSNSDHGKDKQVSTGPLPYLKTEIRVHTVASNEVRVKLINHRGETIFNRKLTSHVPVRIDWGFSVDVKDHIVSHQYTILFLNADKESVSQIVLNTDTDGYFFVNGHKKGRL